MTHDLPMSRTLECSIIVVTCHSLPITNIHSLWHMIYLCHESLNVLSLLSHAVLYILLTSILCDTDSLQLTVHVTLIGSYTPWVTSHKSFAMSNLYNKQTSLHAQHNTTLYPQQQQQQVLFWRGKSATHETLKTIFVKCGEIWDRIF